MKIIKTAKHVEMIEPIRRSLEYAPGKKKESPDRCVGKDVKEAQGPYTPEMEDDYVAQQQRIDRMQRQHGRGRGPAGKHKSRRRMIQELGDKPFGAEHTFEELLQKHKKRDLMQQGLPNDLVPVAGASEVVKEAQGEMPPAGITIGSHLVNSLISLLNIPHDQADQFVTQIEEEIESADWLSTRTGTSWKKSFDPGQARQEEYDNAYRNYNPDLGATSQDSSKKFKVLAEIRKESQKQVSYQEIFDKGLAMYNGNEEEAAKVVLDVMTGGTWAVGNSDEIDKHIANIVKRFGKRSESGPQPVLSVSDTKFRVLAEVNKKAQNLNQLYTKVPLSTGLGHPESGLVPVRVLYEWNESTEGLGQPSYEILAIFDTRNEQDVTAAVEPDIHQDLLQQIDEKETSRTDMFMRQHAQVDGQRFKTLAQVNDWGLDPAAYDESPFSEPPEPGDLANFAEEFDKDENLEDELQGYIDTYNRNGPGAYRFKEDPHGSENYVLIKMDSLAGENPQEITRGEIWDIRDRMKQIKHELGYDFDEPDDRIGDTPLGQELDDNPVEGIDY